MHYIIATLYLHVTSCFYSRLCIFHLPQSCTYQILLRIYLPKLFTYLLAYCILYRRILEPFTAAKPTAELSVKRKIPHYDRPIYAEKRRHKNSKRCRPIVSALPYGD